MPQWEQSECHWHFACSCRRAVAKELRPRDFPSTRTPSLLWQPIAFVPCRRTSARPQCKGRRHLRDGAAGDTLSPGGFMESNGTHDNDPVRSHTSQAVQQRIDSSLEERIRFYASQPKEAISRR